MTEQEIMEKALRYMRRSIEDAKGDGIITHPITGQKIGPGIDYVHKPTGQVITGEDPVKSKEIRITWAMADIMFVHRMGWISEQECDRLSQEVNRAANSPESLTAEHD